MNLLLLRWRRRMDSDAVLIAVKRPTSIYANLGEQMKHYRSIEFIAQRANCPVPAIAPLYENVLADMKSTAQIPDYLPIFVSKRVRQILKI